MPSSPTLHWGQLTVTVVQGETATVTSTATTPSAMTYSVGDTSIATATPNSTWTSWTIQGVSPGTTTVTITGAENMPGDLTITVTGSDDQNFLNERGLAHFWDNIDSAKQDKLTAGSNITINNGTISATQPTVNNATLTIQKNGTTVKTFTANASSNVTANITVPTQFSDLSGTVATAQIAANAVTKAKVDDSGLKNPSVTGAFCYYRRSGHFVWVFGNAAGFALTANNYKTIFTLPSGYRPPVDIYCPLGLSSATKVGILRIRSSGEVQGWADSNTTYWNFSTTFAID